MNNMNADEKMAMEIAQYVNCNHDNKKFVKAMAREHRTLQQQFTRTCVEWLLDLAERENYDLRNEASVKFAKSIKEQLENAEIPYIWKR